MSEYPQEESSLERYQHQPPQGRVASPGRTLLPGPIASLITTFTQTASFSLRVGTKVGGFAIAGARETTLTSLELTRAAVEAILTRAGRDVSERRSDELGRVEAESLLERSVCPVFRCRDGSLLIAYRSHHCTTLYPQYPSSRPRASTYPQPSSLLHPPSQSKDSRP